MSEVRAVLGPTNTGKTHLAVTRMLAHDSGMIGLPLRLLAREVYDRIVAAKGRQSAALVTGEERIIPPGARYYACTVEAMPLSVQTSFLAIDEIQLASDPDRGHVFTDRILNARGMHETMLLGAETMRPALERLGLGIDAEHRERFSKLSYTGPTKLTKLPKRSAVVAFSAEEVYAIAELLKRQRGGAAVVMGALSPRTRNAQVELYQSGEVDYLVATDAIGMGLNMDVHHVAFASRRKFDGHRRRELRADEAAQIAGRAGRFRDDGSFGETADCLPFDEETVAQIENHTFDPVERLSWRNSKLDYSDISSLTYSLSKPSPNKLLARASAILDEVTLQALQGDEDLMQQVTTRSHVRRLWDICCLPDFRKTGADAHVRLVHAFAENLVDPDARLSDKWVHTQIERLNNENGDLDILQSRLAAVRTWTYAANRDDWMRHPKQWRNRTREIEDKLSDALHERLMQRFVDRRTSALLKRLNSEEDMDAGVGADGEVIVEGHHVGKLVGLNFIPAVTSQTLEGRAVRNSAFKALKPIIEEKLGAITAADAGNFSLVQDDEIAFQGQPIGRIRAGAHWLTPQAELVGAPDADQQLRERAETRLQSWIEAHISEVLKPMIDLQSALKMGKLTGLARGVAHQLVDAGGAIDRRKDEVASALTREDRESLKAEGVRTGRIAAYMPGLLKPAQADLSLRLKALMDDGRVFKAPGAASFKTEKGWNRARLEAAGYIRLGPRAVRADMAERLSWTLGQARKEANNSAFVVAPEHAALVGSPADDFVEVLKAMGLIPAQRDKETNAVTLWRFASRKTQDRKKAERQTKAVSDSPFAALAALATPQQETPQRPKKKRRRKPKPAPAQTASEPAAENAGEDQKPEENLTQNQTPEQTEMLQASDASADAEDKTNPETEQG